MDTRKKCSNSSLAVVKVVMISALAHVIPNFVLCFLVVTPDMGYLKYFVVHQPIENPLIGSNAKKWSIIHFSWLFQIKKLLGFLPILHFFPFSQRHIVISVLYYLGFVTVKYSIMLSHQFLNGRYSNWLKLWQCSRLTFQLSSQVASERFDFTSQNNFSLARRFLHNLILCSICLIFSRVKDCKHASM